ncbi:hypothetical protein [Bacillus cereus]|uniref:hypothetical protein n=1 Tax=Bacillus cereus TaxID=1396 RepID=UPI000BED9B2D|nr:hypothetical protein [Bacillus cereus]PEF92568.1 hypothetical protein CON46_11380 [Bacillus cereus]
MKQVISYIFLLLLLGALVGCSKEHVDVEDINEKDEVKTEEVESNSDISSGSVIEESNYETNTHDSTDYDKDGNYKPVEDMTKDEMREELESFLGYVLEK